MEITVDGKQVKLDAQQENLHKYLQNLSQKLVAEHKETAGFFAKLFKKSSPQTNSGNDQYRGLYIHGDVGRGKSMLMMDFFNQAPTKQKIHFHFNNFMRKLHEELHKLRKNLPENEDLVEIATQNIVGNNILICFDEMQVEDVADALLLRRIFTNIFARNIMVIFTSNCHPEELYSQGLQRELFLEFINYTLYPNCHIANLNGNIDYRSDYLKSIKKHYLTPINGKNLKKLQEIFNHITDNNPPYLTEIEVKGRKLQINKSYHNIAWFDFEELCVANLGASDYQQICQKFNIIFLINIPKLSAEERNEAKRLMLFIDEVYENKATLLVLAQTSPEQIYEIGTGAKAFKRAASRLNQLTAILN